MSELLFETMVDLGLIVTGQGVICRVSPSCQDILGYHPDEMTGHSAKEFLYPPDLDATRMEMRASRRGHVTRRFECRYVHKDGIVVALQWTGTWSEEAKQHLFVGRDVTDVRTMMRLTNISEQLQSIDAYLTTYRLRSANWHLFTVLDVILSIASIWVGYILLTPPSNFEAFPKQFALIINITKSEQAWGAFALIAAGFKIGALIVRAYGSVYVATAARGIGRSMSGVLWTLIGTSYLIANPEYSVFGPIGIMFGNFALWAEISEGLYERFIGFVRGVVRRLKAARTNDETSNR